jgi:hypothetical protein
MRLHLRSVLIESVACALLSSAAVAQAQVDDLADFDGDITHPKLVLYVGGNYFFAMSHSIPSGPTPR